MGLTFFLLKSTATGVLGQLSPLTTQWVKTTYSRSACHNPSLVQHVAACSSEPKSTVLVSSGPRVRGAGDQAKAGAKSPLSGLSDRSSRTAHLLGGLLEHRGDLLGDCPAYCVSSGGDMLDGHTGGMLGGSACIGSQPPGDTPNSLAGCQAAVHGLLASLHMGCHWLLKRTQRQACIVITAAAH